MDSFSISIAFSTGITCIPMPFPPSPTKGVTCSRGSLDICSKNRLTSGCSATTCLFILKNSAQPGTNIGSTYCFSCRSFSQLYSKMPLTDISISLGSNSSFESPVSFTISSKVFGLRTPIFKAISASSSVSTPASPQYSGSSWVIFLMPSFWGILSVIIFPSFKMLSRGGPSSPPLCSGYT